jgi:hypothetical protein
LRFVESDFYRRSLTASAALAERALQFGRVNPSANPLYDENPLASREVEPLRGKAAGENEERTRRV